MRKLIFKLLVLFAVAQLAMYPGAAPTTAHAATGRPSASARSGGGLWQNLVGFVRALVEERPNAKLGADGGDVEAGVESSDGADGTCPDGADFDGVECDPVVDADIGDADADGPCDGGDVDCGDADASDVDVGDADATDATDGSDLDDIVALLRLIVALLIALLFAGLG